MIFKRPYAFLIKYFKLINLALAALAMYVMYRSYNIVSFFSEYITSHYSGSFYPGFENEYVSSLLLLAIFVILVGIGGMILLFFYKKKPSKAYIISALYYIVFFILLFYVKNLLGGLTDNILEAETARVYRDLALISIIPQLGFIIFFFIRGLGFNIEQFDFKKDLKDLEISEEDSEEIEITIKGDTFKLKRGIHRFFREFGYYIQENRFIFIIICLVLFAFLVTFVYKSFPEVFDKKYSQGDIFESLGISYNVEDSILTNLDYKGNKISDDKYYLVVRLYVENNGVNSYSFDFNRFRLEVDNKYLYPVQDKSLYFIDYAKEYYGMDLKPKSNRIISLVYEIDNNKLKKSYRIKIDNGVVNSKKGQKDRYNFVNISPIVLDRVVSEGEYELGTSVSLQNSNLGNTIVKFSNLNITDKHIYTYQICTVQICNEYKRQINIDYTKNNKILIVLDYEYTLDETVPFYNNTTDMKSLAERFFKVRYLDGSKTVYEDAKNVTPTNLEGQLVFEVSNKVKDTKELDLILAVRNKEYYFKLK